MSNPSITLYSIWIFGILGSCSQTAKIAEWEELPSLTNSSGLAGGFAGVLDGNLVIAGGTNFPKASFFAGGKKTWHKEIHLFQNGQWNKVGNLPEPRAYGLSLTIESGILLIGGTDSTNTPQDEVLLLTAKDHGSIVFEHFPDLPKPIANSCGAIADNIIYLAGEVSGNGDYESKKVFYSLNLGNIELGWKTLDPWPGLPRSYASAAAFGKEFYLFGGRTNDLKDPSQRIYHLDAFSFHPEKGWSKLSDLPFRLSNAPTTPFAVSGKLWVLGGVTGKFSREEAIALGNNHPGFSEKILSYDPVEGFWKYETNLPKVDGKDPVDQPGECIWPPINTPVVIWEDKLVLISGEIRPGTRTPKVLTFLLSEFKLR